MEFDISVYLIRFGVYVYVMLHTTLGNAECNTCDEKLDTLCSSRNNDHDSRETDNNGGAQLLDCSDIRNNLGKFEVDTHINRQSISWINEFHSDARISSGGSWCPQECLPTQKIAILIPFRNRYEDLKIFLYNMHTFLRAQLTCYRVFLIEQMDKKHFNRGSLLNVGYVEAAKIFDFDCIMLHDIDKWPEDTRNIYQCETTPKHMIGKQRYISAAYRKRPYETYFGGVTAISAEHFKQINGFSNVFWGWGSEDDDLRNRITYHKLGYARSDDEVGTFIESYQRLGFVVPDRHELVKKNEKAYKKSASDGLTNVKYSVVAITNEPLFTNISVYLEDRDPYIKDEL